MFVFLSRRGSQSQISLARHPGSLLASIARRVELLLGFKFTGKMVKNIKFTGKIGKNGKKWLIFLLVNLTKVVIKTMLFIIVSVYLLADYCNCHENLYLLSF